MDTVLLQVPIWIRILDLPLTLWTKSSVEKIASTVGTPVAVDHGTIRRQTLDGPRVQVVLNVLEDPREKLEIVLPDGTVLQQKIVYEQLPKFCHVGHAFGHIALGCSGPEERERIRLANKKRDPSRGRVQSRGWGPSCGRNTAVRGSANGPMTEAADDNQGRSLQPVGGNKVWVLSGKNKSNGYKGPVPSTSHGVETNNQFNILQELDATGAAGALVAEGVVLETQPGQLSQAGRSKRSASRGRNAVVIPTEKPGPCEPQQDIPYMPNTQVEDSECEGLDEINAMVAQFGVGHGRNMTFRGGCP